MSVAERIVVGASALGLELTAQAGERMASHLLLIEKWNRVHNLTAVQEQEQMVTLHVLDELLLTKVVTPAARKDAELFAWSTIHGLANIMLSHSLINHDSVNVEQVTLGIVRRLLHGLRTD